MPLSFTFSSSSFFFGYKLNIQNLLVKFISAFLSAYRSYQYFFLDNRSKSLVFEPSKFSSTLKTKLQLPLHCTDFPDQIMIYQSYMYILTKCRNEWIKYSIRQAIYNFILKFGQNKKNEKRGISFLFFFQIFWFDGQEFLNICSYVLQIKKFDVRCSILMKSTLSLSLGLSHIDTIKMETVFS